MTTNTIASRPIPAAHGKNKIYLQMFQQESAGLPPRIRLIPTEVGRHALNPFWPVWLRQMILHKTRSEASFSVEIQNKYVMLSGGSSLAALEPTVVGLAAQIRPLPEVLKLNDDAPEHVLRWAIRDKRRYIPIDMMVSALKVPKGISVSFDAYWYPDDNYSSMLSVSRRKNDRRSMRDLRLDIELQVALMCE